MNNSSTGSASLSPADIKEVIQLLQKLQPGFLPFPIFNAICRLVVTAIVELVPLRRTPDGRTEVLLTQREADDPFWPRKWHNPGTVIRSTDIDEAAALARVLQNELQLPLDNTPGPTYAGHLFHSTIRGAEATQVYYIELAENPPTGTFYDVEQLPEDMIESHVKVVHKAVQAFQERTE